VGHTTQLQPTHLAIPNSAPSRPRSASAASFSGLYGTRAVTVVLQVRGKAVWYAWRSFDPADPVQAAPAAAAAVAPAGVAPTAAAAALAEAEAAAVARAEAQALKTGMGTAKQLVPLEEGAAPGGSGSSHGGGGHRHHDHHPYRHAAHHHRTVTVAGLEWTLYRMPLVTPSGAAGGSGAAAAATAAQEPDATTA
jgi:hypothetical protein